MKLKIFYIISFIDKALIYDWTVQHFAQSKEFDVGYILLNPAETDLARIIKANNASFYFIKYNGKKDLLRAVFNIYKILIKHKPRIINTNLFDASFAGQIAGWLARTPVRIHSRHYSSLHHEYFQNALKYDRLLNKISTKIVVATKMVKDILVEKEKVPPAKIAVINYGFKLDQFVSVNPDRVIVLKKKYRIENAYPVIGAISRFVHWKGVQYLIPAFQQLLNACPAAHLVLANAQGDYKENLEKLLSHIPAKNFTLIRYENDSPALYRMFDFFIHVPVNYHSEAFGQIYIESLACGIPGIFTISGIANDFIMDEKNAVVVPYMNSEAIFQAIKRLINDKPLKDQIIEQGKKDVNNLFQFDDMMKKTEQLFRDEMKMK